MGADIYWSRNGEEYNYDSLGDLIDCNDDLEVGQTVWFGESVTPDPTKWVDCERLIEVMLDDMGEAAHEQCGEYAEDYPDPSKEALAELESMLSTWVKKHCAPTFFTITKSQEYTITAEDIEATP